MLLLNPVFLTLFSVNNENYLFICLFVYSFPLYVPCITYAFSAEWELSSKSSPTSCFWRFWLFSASPLLLSPHYFSFFFFFFFFFFKLKCVAPNWVHSSSCHSCTVFWANILRTARCHLCSPSQFCCSRKQLTVLANEVVVEALHRSKSRAYAYRNALHNICLVWQRILLVEEGYTLSSLHMTVFMRRTILEGFNKVEIYLLFSPCSHWRKLNWFNKSVFLTKPCWLLLISLLFPEWLQIIWLFPYFSKNWPSLRAL